MQPEGREHHGTPRIGCEQPRLAEGIMRERRGHGRNGEIRTIGLDNERATWHNARSFQGVCVSR